MSEISIEVENLGKKYSIAPQARYQRVSELLQNSLKRVLHRSVCRAKPSESKRSVSNGAFWALSDVSFDVKEGEILGIIGRNGAGKSTLLKILSRITEPTSGRFGLRGRVSSLLEVGTGFHPELTGRENIFLNGAVLGMTRREISRKFDEIVSFAVVEDFLDTRVKYYSNGMHVRLGFSVAAHLDPEILIVDEVLAVGDGAFQRKCLGKMKDVTSCGRTVLFVSHNMGAIQRLCTSALLLEKGCIAKHGDTQSVVDTYIDAIVPTGGFDSIEQQVNDLPGDPLFELIDVRIEQCKKQSLYISNGNPTDLIVKFRILEQVKGLRIWFDVYDPSDTLIFRSFHDDLDSIPSVMNPGDYLVTGTIPSNVFGPVGYRIQLHAGLVGGRHCMPPVSMALQVTNDSSIGQVYPHTKFAGRVMSPTQWRPVQNI